MLVKIVSLFLIGIVVLAMFGRLRWPGGARRIGRDQAGKLKKPTRCKACGAFRIGSGPCPCGKG